MRALVLSSLAVAALILIFAGCTTTTSYWSRPGAELQDLASESHSCYAAAVGADSPSASPALRAEQNPAASTAPVPRGGRLLPSTEPPPKLWARAPRDAGFERFDEQQRYERCMQQRGWRPTRP
jgi:hypothetical protein